MITSLYYYNYYKPHILKSAKTKAVKQDTQNATLKSDLGKPINLSKAYNKSVLQYVSNLSSSVNAVRMSGNSLFQAFKKVAYFSEETEKKDSKPAKSSKKSGSSEKELANKDDLIIGLEDLTSALNKTCDFQETQSQSDEYDKFSRNLKNIVNNNSNSLKQLNLTYDNGKFNFDAEAFDEKSMGEISKAVSNNTDVVSSINTATSNFMNVPMSNHMEFKNLSYYFNYASGNIRNNSFNVIGTGTIINLAL